MRPSYRNAYEVFPRELVHVLQQCHVGLVYIPKPGGYYKERAQLIVRLSGQGVASREIANLCGITQRRVNQILRQHRLACREEKV